MGKLRTAIKKDFTVVHNEFIRDERVGIEEMGMLVFLLSLPDSWNFSIEGLTKVLPNGKHKIMTTLNKLKELGYFRRIRQIDDRGRVIDWVYEFSDECHPEWLTDEEESEVITPHSDNRDMDKSDMENQPQSNIIESNKNNDYESLHQPDESRKDKYISYTSMIRDNINYSELKKTEDNKTVDRIIDIMVNTIISEKEKIRINKKEISIDKLTADLMIVSEADIRQIIAAIKGKSIRCFEKYVLAALTNAVSNKSEPKPVEFQTYSTDTLDFYADACDYSFNDEEMQYIETMLIRIVPTVGRNTEIELERFNYLRSKYLFMRAQNSRKKIKNKFGYITKMIEEEMA